MINIQTLFVPRRGDVGVYFARTVTQPGISSRSRVDEHPSLEQMGQCKDLQVSSPGTCLVHLRGPDVGDHVRVTCIDQPMFTIKQMLKITHVLYNGSPDSNVLTLIDVDSR